MLRTRLLAPALLGLACGAPEPTTTATDEACAPTFRYPAGLSPAVGEPVVIAPELACLPFGPRSYRLVPREQPTRGLTLGGDGRLTGAIEGRLARPGRAYTDTLELDVRLCVSKPLVPVKVVDPKLPSRFRVKPGALAYVKDGVKQLIAPTDVVYRIETANLSWSPETSAMESFERALVAGGRPTAIWLVNGTPFASETLEPGATPLAEIEALRECEEALAPGLPPDVAEALRTECRLRVESDLGECRDAADVEACVAERAARRRRPYDCARNQLQLDARLTLAIRDAAPLSIARDYAPAAWGEGVFTERSIEVRGGRGARTFRVRNGALPAGVNLDPATGKLTGRIFAVDDGREVSIEVEDADHRRVETDVRFTTDAAEVAARFCATADLTPPCLVVRRPGARAGGLVENGQRLDLPNLENVEWDQFPPAGVPDYGVNDRIRSVRVASGFVATICGHEFLAGECSTLGANSAARPHTTLDPATWGRWVSSLEVRPAGPPASPGYRYQDDFPSEQESEWAEQAQGIAHDDRHFYTTDAWRVYKYPVTSPMTSAHRVARWSTRAVWQGDGATYFCQHLGDPDFFNGRLYVPAYDCFDGLARVYVLDEDLEELEELGLPDDMSSLPFIAVDPITRSFVTTEGSNPNALTVLTRWGGGLRRSHTIRLDLPDENDEVDWVQGGAFSTSGRFYLVAENLRGRHRENGRGVFVFDLRGGRAVPVRFADGTNRIGIYDYDAWIGDYRNIELEGITIWDVPANAHAGYRGTQIHYVKLNNDAGDDDVSVRHVALDDPDAL